MARTVRELLLTRTGRAYIHSHGPPLDDDLVRAVELELAAIGYVVSSALRARLATSSRDELVSFRAWALESLLAHLGGNQKHEPLFREFPDGVPEDTAALWWRRVLVHFLQGDRQSCLHCGRLGTTRVLSPCQHVVCEHCFDGENYSGCPICGRKVDPSPFFQPTEPRAPNTQPVRFKLIDLGHDEASDARALFESLCARKQVLSPDDREALKLVARLDWLPRQIPVRENVAIVFGTLFLRDDPDAVLPHARRFMSIATDVLRFLAVISGADASLQGEVRDPRARPPVKVRRFKMAKLRRPLRRALLAVLDGLDEARLVEDMLRHRSYWVWAGEFLHPGEHATRFPNVARAFAVVRGEAEAETWYAKVEKAFTARDGARLVEVLEERPGELARKFDHALRTAGADAVLAAFRRHLHAYATPVLLTLHNHLPQRATRVGTRVYWPKGAVAKGVFAKDAREPLSATTIATALADVEGELLKRFAEKPPFDDALVDDALRAVMVPFNERTASPSAVNLPRGSRVAIPPGNVARLFLHWCEPEGGERTDIDLSVGFYDASWRHTGVCSYYQLALDVGSTRVAASSGDFTSAPFPDGASEFVDIHRAEALAVGFRYAVMVVNDFAGLPFSKLERGFAGLMIRDDDRGLHFDPRTVALRFALSGSNGIYMPLVLDLQENTLHWLDVQSTGQLSFNNVATSNHAITTICPALMEYFASGTRTSMFELAALHAAARCRRVIVRGPKPMLFVRRDEEDARTFHGRIVAGKADERRMPRLEGPTFAALHTGDIDLPPGSLAYALFRERLSSSISASDLLS